MRDSLVLSSAHNSATTYVYSHAGTTVVTECYHGDALWVRASSTRKIFLPLTNTMCTPALLLQRNAAKVMCCGFNKIQDQLPASLRYAVSQNLLTIPRMFGVHWTNTILRHLYMLIPDFTEHISFFCHIENISESHHIQPIYRVIFQ